MIDNYSKLTLEKYLELRGMETDGREELDLQVEVISILSDMSEDEILSLSLPEYQRLAAKTVFLTHEPKVSDRPPKTVKIGDRVYDVMKDIRHFTAGQYIDYQNHIKTDDIESNLPTLMTVFLIPKGKKYGDGYDIADILPDMGLIPIETVLSLARFFFRKSRNLIDSTLTSLDWMMKRMERKEKDPMKKEKMRQAREGLRSLRSSVSVGDGYTM